MSRRLLQSLTIIGIASLLGLSVAKVAAADPLAFSGGAAFIAAIAVGIVGLFHQPIASFEKITPPRKLLGLRIGVVGFVVALCGWLVAIFLSATVGYYIVVFGVLVGFVGFPIHIYNMFRS
jgi:uncharacterized membrane protein